MVRWKLAVDDKCPLCGGAQTLHHVLSACKVSLACGRYTWRHNQVLEKVVQAIEEAIDSVGKAGLVHDRRQEVANILQGSSDWKVAADLRSRRNYSDLIADCGDRPDIVVTSESSKTVIVIELTVPYETNMSGSHEFKMAKYEGLVTRMHGKGYRVHLFAIEVGARGFAGSSVYNLLKRVGLTSRRRAYYLQQVAETAEGGSYWIWLKRNDKSWTSSINSS